MQEVVAGATEQAKDAVQQAGQQVQTQVQELELMQKEIERLKEAPVSVSEDAQNQSRIRQLEHEVLRVRQEINVALEIAEHEVKEVCDLVGLVKWFQMQGSMLLHTFLTLRSKLAGCPDCAS